MMSTVEEQSHSHVCGALRVSEEFEPFDPGGAEGTEVDLKQQEVFGVCAK